MMRSHLFLRPRGTCFLLGALVLLPGLGAALAQEGQDPRGEDRGGYEDAHEAYRAGAFGEAAQRFAQRAERRPDDPRLQHNLGSALHHLDDYGAAQSAWERALEVGEERDLRVRTLYNLGNNAYRQGRLEDAIEHYEEALAVDPEDEDAKFNLEFVQKELERRRDQAQDRPQQSQQEQSSPEQQQEQQQEQEQGGDGESSGGEQQEQQDDAGRQPEGGDEASESGADSDGDGLPDATERGGENPTDPRNSDTDGDGRSDGEEDRNRNGRVDQGESDPNVPDAEPGEPRRGEGSGQASPAPLSLEEAQRLLASLQDARPAGPRKVGEPESARKSDKDW